MVNLSVSTTGLSELYQDLRKFEPALGVGLRRALKASSGRAVEAVKRELAAPSPDGGPNEGDGRAAIAAGTKAVVSFSKRSAGVKITSSAGKLPAEHKALLKVYNLGRFRHPIFGTDTWVEQRGHPYFGAAIAKSVDKDLIDEMQAAVDYAVQAIGARG